jgi:hypothetical protein
MWRKKIMTTNFTKQPPLLEDLRSHTPEQLAELRLLLSSGAPSRPDPRRPGFFELDGTENVFYVFKYPTGTKVLLVGVWERERDRVAELAALSCYSAAWSGYAETTFAARHVLVARFIFCPRPISTRLNW